MYVPYQLFVIDFFSFTHDHINVYSIVGFVFLAGHQWRIRAYKVCHLFGGCNFCESNFLHKSFTIFFFNNWEVNVVDKKPISMIVIMIWQIINVLNRRELPHNFKLFWSNSFLRECLKITPMYHSVNYC